MNPQQSELPQVVGALWRHCPGVLHAYERSPAFGLSLRLAADIRIT